MKKYFLGSLLLLAVTITGCSKSDSPISTSTTGTISGNIKNSITSTGVAGVKVSVKELSITATTDNSGNYSFQEVAEGTYSLAVTDPGYQTKTIANVAVTKTNTTSINPAIQPIIWSIPKTDNNSTVVLLASSNPNIKGVAITTGDIVGCFYDSLGTTKACAGYTELTGALTANLAITVWGDDGMTSAKKEGMNSNEAYKWKVKRKSDGKVFDATATYSIGGGSYSTNGTSVISAFSITAD